MLENDKNCEANCVYFSVLTSDQQRYFQFAKEALINGIEIPGILNTFCASCTSIKINDSIINDQIEALVSKS